MITVQTKPTRHPRMGVLLCILSCLFWVSCLEDESTQKEPGGFSSVSTLAGSAEPGFVDGIGALAKFNSPCAMAVDREGNLYVSDYENHTIRRITPRGVVSTYAGTGKPGQNDGQRLSASFNHPYGLALDPEGNLYVGDVANHRIRKIAANGTVTTFAGKKKGFGDHKGTQARFNHPYGVTVDYNGNVYVADSYNHRIRKITPDGAVSTVAGSGNDGFVDRFGTEAEFYVPVGIVVDDEGNLFIGDEGNSSIRKISPAGHVMTLAGNGKFSFADGVGREATFNAPGGIAIDRHGNLFVADYFNNCIRRVTPSGEVRKIAGNLKKGFADGKPSEAQFFYPFGIAVDAEGAIYVGDQNNHRIRKIH